MSHLHEIPGVGVQLRLQAGEPDVEAAVAAYERQFRTTVKRSGTNIFVTLFAPRTGPRFFSVPDQFRPLKFEWLVVLREEVVGFQTSSARDAPYGVAVLIPHSGGQSLRPFGREKGKASFSGRSLLVERLHWVKPTPGTPVGTCTVGLKTLTVSLRPKFQRSREEREELELPRESPYGFEPKVEELGEGLTLQLDLTREGGVEQVVVPRSQGSFKPTVGWAELSPARKAAVSKLLCGVYLEDYRLDSHERWRRFNDRAGQSEWVVPADTSTWRRENQDKPRWQWGSEPREQRCQAEFGLDGLPVRRAKDCCHLHFAMGVDPGHVEPEEDEDGGRYYDEDRW